MSWHVLILAGSRGAHDAVASAAGVGHKAFAPICGKPMIAHVADALTEAPETGDICVSIAPDAPSLPQGLEREDAGASPAASVLAAFDRLGAPLLVTTADHPLLTAGMISAFLAAAEASGADAVAGVCPRATVDQAGNPARRTYLHLSDGLVSGTNLFALRTPQARGAIAFWRRLEQDRKRPWRMAWRVGPGVLLRYLAGRLDRAGAAAALGRAANCRAALVTVDHMDAAHDVDTPADLIFATERLQARKALT